MASHTSKSSRFDPKTGLIRQGRDEAPARSPFNEVHKWILPALLLTLIVQLILLAIALWTHVDILNPAYYDEIIPPAFQMRQVNIDPKRFEPPGAGTDKKDVTTPNPQVTDLLMSGQKPSFEQEIAQAQSAIPAPKVGEPTAPTADKLKSTTPDELAKTLQETMNSGAPPLPEDVNALRDQIANEQSSQSANNSVLTVPGMEDATQSLQSTKGVAASRPSFSNLDSLLNKKGGLSGGEGPILLPTDLLFDYDAAVLRSDAAKSLSKLGQLIRQNPQATFTIDGHSDLFGSPSYNQTLSERRAQSVKEWLVRNADIDPARITTRGFGSRHPLVPTGDVLQQQLNRRVEIVIHTRRD